MSIDYSQFDSIHAFLMAIPPNNNGLCEKLTNTIHLNTWIQFVRTVNEYIRTEYPDYPITNVRESSSFAVCQEFLGLLEGNDLLYAQNRGGTWTSIGSNHITLRDVIDGLKLRFP